MQGSRQTVDVIGAPEGGAGPSARPHYVRNAELEVVMAYEHADVVERYLTEHPCSRARADLLFDDLKRWLWLCAETGRARTLGDDAPDLTIFDGQLELDEMWHTFILFTADYTDFCVRYFGRYIHHRPTPVSQRRDQQTLAGRARERALQRHFREVREVAAYVFDMLGEDVARRWYLPTA